MNWWIVIYLAFYFGLLLFSLWDDITEKEPIWYIALDVLCDVSAISLIIGFWLLPSPENYGLLWLTLFVCSLAWLILSAPHELRKNGIDSELTNKENRVGIFIGFFAAYTFLRARLCLGRFTVVEILAERRLKLSKSIEQAAKMIRLDIACVCNLLRPSTVRSVNAK